MPLIFIFYCFSWAYARFGNKFIHITLQIIFAKIQSKKRFSSMVQQVSILTFVTAWIQFLSLMFSFGRIIFFGYWVSAINSFFIFLPSTVLVRPWCLAVNFSRILKIFFFSIFHNLLIYSFFSGKWLPFLFISYHYNIRKLRTVLGWYSRSLDLHSLCKKWSFPLKIYSLNVTKVGGVCALGHIYCKNL